MPDSAAPWESLLRQFGSAATDLAAGTIKGHLGLPAVSALPGGHDLAALVAAAAVEAGGTAERLGDGAFAVTVRAAGGRPVGVLVQDLGVVVALSVPGVFQCRTGTEPEGLADYLLARSAGFGFGGWARSRRGGLDDYYPKACVPRSGLTASALARVAFGLAAEAAGLLAELGGG